MWHFGQIGSDKATFDVFAHTDDHRVDLGLSHLGTEHITQGHNFAIRVRYFYSDSRFARNGRENVDLIGGHRVGNIFRQSGHPLHFGAHPQFHFIAGNRGPSGEINHFGVDFKLFENTGNGGNNQIICLTAGFRWSPRDEYRAAG